MSGGGGLLLLLCGCRWNAASKSGGKKDDTGRPPIAGCEGREGREGCRAELTAAGGVDGWAY